VCHADEHLDTASHHLLDDETVHGKANGSDSLSDFTRCLCDLRRSG
jgi:hypothetical protein